MGEVIVVTSGKGGCRVKQPQLPISERDLRCLTKKQL